MSILKNKKFYCLPSARLKVCASVFNDNQSVINKTKFIKSKYLTKFEIL